MVSKKTLNIAIKCVEWCYQNINSDNKQLKNNELKALEELRNILFELKEKELKNEKRWSTSKC